MTCKDFEREIVLYALGELAEEKKSSVELHIKGCSSCARFANAVSNVYRAASASGKTQKEIDVWPEVKEKILASPKRSFAPKWALIPALTALIIGITFTRMFSPPVINIDPQDMQMLKEFELLADYELWEDLEALENSQLTL